MIKRTGLWLRYKVTVISHHFIRSSQGLANRPCLPVWQRSFLLCEAGNKYLHLEDMLSGILSEVANVKTHYQLQRPERLYVSKIYCFEFKPCNSLTLSSISHNPLSKIKPGKDSKYFKSIFTFLQKHSELFPNQ